MAVPPLDALRQTDPLGAAFLEAFQSASPPVPGVVGFTDRLVITIPAASTDVGDLIVQSDQDELTVRLDRHTHGHFPLYMFQDLSPIDARSAVVAATLKFLRDLLADQIAVWSHWQGDTNVAGGWFYVGQYEPELQRPGSRAYLWSGAPFIPSAHPRGA